eukprot:scaffold121_cov412-Prasinococcus_capsulatus_cf.AAC.1
MCQSGASEVSNSGSLSQGPSRTPNIMLQHHDDVVANWKEGEAWPRAANAVRAPCRMRHSSCSVLSSTRENASTLTKLQAAAARWPFPETTMEGRGRPE